VIREGDAGRKWIHALPGLVEDLCQHWNLRRDGPVMHGYLGLVIPVRRVEEPCVLKVSWTDGAASEEAMVLAAWNGQGAVRLLASQPALGALLLERLDHRRSLNDVEIVEAVEVASRLLRRLSIPVPSDFRSLRLVTQDLCHTLPQRWEQYGRPMPQRWVEQACELAVQLGTSCGNLLVNYDLHYADVLRGKRGALARRGPKGGHRRSGVWDRATAVVSSGGHRSERRSGSPFPYVDRGSYIRSCSGSLLDACPLRGLLVVGSERWLNP